jgi:hypothetical protein
MRVLCETSNVVREKGKKDDVVAVDEGDRVEQSLKRWSLMIECTTSFIQQ